MAESVSASDPVSRGFDISPSDTVNFTQCDTVRGIWVGGAGAVSVAWSNDTPGVPSFTIFTCVAGQLLPVRAKRVNLAGTTATLLRGMF